MEASKSIETIPVAIEAIPVIFNHDPVKAIEEAQTLIQAMSSKCQGEKFIANIQGKRYPKVEWWTTVGAVKGLFPYTIHSVRLDREDEICYESRVEIRNSLTGIAVTSAEAICSTKESRWKGRDEYAIKSMSITRATAKAYRIGLSFLAVLAGLEATPAEEVPPEGFERTAKPKADIIPVDLTGIKPEQIEDERGRIREYLIAASEGSEAGAKEKLKKLAVKYGKRTDSTKVLTSEQVHGVFMELRKEIELFDGGSKGTGERK